MPVDSNGDWCQEVPQVNKMGSSMGLNNLLRCYRSDGFRHRLREKNKKYLL